MYKTPSLERKNFAFPDENSGPDPSLMGFSFPLPAFPIRPQSPLYPRRALGLQQALTLVSNWTFLQTSCPLQMTSICLNLAHIFPVNIQLSPEGLILCPRLCHSPGVGPGPSQGFMGLSCAVLNCQVTDKTNFSHRCEEESKCLLVTYMASNYSSALLVYVSNVHKMLNVINTRPRGI